MVFPRDYFLVDFFILNSKLYSIKFFYFLDSLAILIERV